MAAEKTIIFITGGNSGVGLELATQLLSDASKHILLGCRSIEKGEAAVAELQSRSQPGSVELLHLDTASDSSISSIAKHVEEKHGRIDSIVNNAAVGSPDGPLSEQMATCFQTNATGPFLLVEAFVPLLRKAAESGGTPRIINVSSGGGSITRRLDPGSASHNIGLWGLPYCASKAALNLITAAQATTYGKEGFKVFAYSPGFVISNLGPHNNAANGAKPTSEGAAPIVKILNGEREDEHGGFLSVTGQYTW